MKLDNHGEQNVCPEFHRWLGVDLMGFVVCHVESLGKERMKRKSFFPFWVYNEISPRKWNYFRAMARQIEK